MNDYKGYSLFNDVEDKTLQTWNRLAAMFNITSDDGPQEATRYADNFSDGEKIGMKVMLKRVEDEGYSTVRKTING